MASIKQMETKDGKRFFQICVSRGMAKPRTKSGGIGRMGGAGARPNVKRQRWPPNLSGPVAPGKS